MGGPLVAAGPLEEGTEIVWRFWICVFLWVVGEVVLVVVGVVDLGRVTGLLSEAGDVGFKGEVDVMLECGRVRDVSLTSSDDMSLGLRSKWDVSFWGDEAVMGPLDNGLFCNSALSSSVTEPFSITGMIVCKESSSSTSLSLCVTGS